MLKNRSNLVVRQCIRKKARIDLVNEFMPLLSLSTG